MPGLFGRLFSSHVGKKEHKFCTAVVAAAGSSSRMGGENKLFALIDDKPVLAYTLEVLQSCPSVDEIVIVTRSEDIPAVADLCAAYDIDKASKIICGGDTRTQSVLIGSLEASSKAELLAIHDGARPFVTAEIVEKTILAAEDYNAAAPAIPVKDTIKVAHGGVIDHTPDRSELFAVQTPQVFSAELLKAALHNASIKNIQLTDDCMAAEVMGTAVHLTEGSEENIKITTPMDLLLAELIIQRRSQV